MLNSANLPNPKKDNLMVKHPPLENDQLHKASVLAEALPYMREFSGETFVIKFGGSAMGDPNLAQTFARDVVLLKQVGINPVVVHGGGPQISSMLERLKIKSGFIDGLRITDKATVEVVEMVLSGSINKDIVQQVNAAGGAAIGISGKDGNLITVRKMRRTKRDPDSNIEQILDLGFVGEPVEINPEILITFEESDLIPIIAPIGLDKQGNTFNINADSAAGALAMALGAHKLIMLTDVPGIMDNENKLISQIHTGDAGRLIRQGTITGGMIPKLETCMSAINSTEVDAAHILDGRIPHVLLLELFTEHGTGTMITEK